MTLSRKAMREYQRQRRATLKQASLERAAATDPIKRAEVAEASVTQLNQQVQELQEEAEMLRTTNLAARRR